MKIPFVPEGANNIKKTFNYLKYNGLGGVLSNVRYRMSGPGLAYNSWYKELHEADEEQLAYQREHSFSYEPVISIIVPVYMTPEFYLRSMIESVQTQTYENWQLCIIDGSQADGVDADGNPTTSVYEKVYSIETERIVRQYAEQDERISYRLLEKNGGICENANVALSMARGDYVAVMNHDDVITEDALYCVVQALNENETPYDVLYSDEDKMSEDGTKFSDPAFKPDFSKDLLRSCNYMEHLFVAKREIALRCGGFRKGYEGAWSYDFILRCCELAASIKHIPRVLYHWRITNKTLNKPKKSEMNKEVFKRALSSHIERCREYATVVGTSVPDMCKVIYETPGNPFISIIIPGGDNVDTMDRCLKPLFEYSRYSNFEIIIIDNIGDNDDMVRFYRRMERDRKNIKVIVNTETKTKHEMRNFGASKAKGKYLLFLDAETELIDATSIGEMLGLCMRQDVGVVGGTLYNDNNTISSAGIVVGLNGVADFVYQGVRKGEPGYLMYNRANRNCSAVSAACMMVKTELFTHLRGFSSDFSSYLADVDFCLRCRELYYLIVSVADASWYIHGRTSKADIGAGNFRAEENLFRNLWSDIIENGDPYYNANFAKEGTPFSLEKEG